MRPFRSALPVLTRTLLALLGACKADPAPSHLLWPQGAPGSEAHRGETETSGSWWVANVHSPSVTVFAAVEARSRGAAVVVVPGGGHRRLVFGPEGLEVGKHLAQRGLTVFVLKYRLALAEGSPYDIERHSRADVARAIRWVKHHAADYDVDPERVGVMGFSAGGELASLVSFGDTEGHAESDDPIDRHSALPAFHIAIYPGSRGIPHALTDQAPPLFLLSAANDDYASEPVEALFRLYETAGRPVERHLLEEGGHGFNLGKGAASEAVRRWPERLSRWLRARGLIT